MLDAANHKNPNVVAFEQKIPGMYAALVKHETIALQEVFARYARSRMGDVPLDVGSEIDIAAVTAVTVPVIANALLTSGVDGELIRVALDTGDLVTLENRVNALVTEMVRHLRANVPLIASKAAAATAEAHRAFADDRARTDG